MKVQRLRNRFRELLAVKERHEGRRISQRQAADELGLAKGAVDRYARNEVTRYDERIVLLFCEYFNCTVGDFLVIEEVNEGNGGESPETKTLLAIPA